MGVYVSPHKYTNMKSIFIQQFLGSSLLSPAYGCGGTRATKNMIVRPPKKIWAKPKQAGKKEGGLGEGIFARLLCPPKAGWEWESVSAIPASAGRQNGGGRKRWAGLSPVGRQSKVSVRILGEIGSDFNQKAPPEPLRAKEPQQR